MEQTINYGEQLRLYNIAIWCLGRPQTVKVRNTLRRIKIRMNYLIALM